MSAQVWVAVASMFWFVTAEIVTIIVLHFCTGDFLLLPLRLALPYLFDMRP